MSRIGKQPIIIPDGVQFKLDKDIVMVKGPKGELTQKVHPDVLVEQKDNQVLITVKDATEKSQKSLWGLFRRLINNMIIGVTQGFSKQLEINGVGFKAATAGKVLTLQLGYSHPVVYDFPKGIDIVVEKNVVTISGIDKQVVGETAAKIRSFRPPEPYKGKGIKYANEILIRKVGKAASKGE